MGTVWLADHLTLEVPVAVKVVTRERWSSEGVALARFRREVGVAARLGCPHAVRILDHGTTADGDPFMVMELLEGETLGDRLRREGRLVAAEVGALVSQLASVLDEAHRAGVVHRDVKPDNIFLVATDYPIFAKLIDFGIAKRLEEAAATTSTGVVLGTPHYMSPEQLLAKDTVDHRTDLWSLAVVAYEALTGRRPFVGSTLAALSVAICHGDFEAPCSLCPELPAAVDAWFGRALSTAPERRFASAKEQARALLAALGDAEASATLPLGEARARAPAEDEPTCTEVAGEPTTGALASLSAQAVAPARGWARLGAVGLAGASLVAGWALYGAERAPVADLAARIPLLAVSGPVRELPTAAPVDATALARSSAPPAVPAPRPSVAKRSAARTAPSVDPCAGDAAFERDADGHLQLRAACMPSQR